MGRLQVGHSSDRHVCGLPPQAARVEPKFNHRRGNAATATPSTRTHPSAYAVAYRLLRCAIAQYRAYAGSKARYLNEQFIELFDLDLVTLPRQLPPWLSRPLAALREEVVEAQQSTLRRISGTSHTPPTPVAKS